MQPTTTTTLAEKVEIFKKIARNALRMNLISPRLSRITVLESALQEAEKAKAELNHKVEVQNYEISKLDTNHPDYADFKAKKEEKLKGYAETLVAYNKDVEDLNKLITEQQEGIKNIELGVTKVSLDDLNSMVENLITEHAGTLASNA